MKAVPIASKGKLMSRPSKASSIQTKHSALKPGTEDASPVPQRPILALSDLCNNAADHIAYARSALFIQGADTETALAHLDDAIGCLKDVLNQSKELLGNKDDISRRFA